jgi:hypothetical protein
MVGDGVVVCGRHRFGVMGVPAEHGITASFTGAARGAGADLGGTTDEGFGAFLGEAGDVMSTVDLLEQPINRVAQPGDDGVVLDEVVELMAVDDENLAAPRAEDELFDDRDAQEVGDDIGGAVVIAGDPDDLDFVRKVADLGEDFPVRLF